MTDNLFKSRLSNMHLTSLVTLARAIPIVLLCRPILSNSLTVRDTRNGVLEARRSVDFSDTLQERDYDAM